MRPDTVCQNTVHAKLCGYSPLTNAAIMIKCFIIKLFVQNLRLYFIIWITSGCIKYFFHSVLWFNFVELMVFFITFLFTENTISPIRSGSNTIWTYNCTLLDLLSGTSFVVFLCAKHVIFCLLVYDLQQYLWYFTTKLSDTTWVIEDTSSINSLYTSSWRTSATLIKVSLPLSVKMYNCSRFLHWQMIHWFQSIEGLLLFALDGRSLSGLPNCHFPKKNYNSSDKWFSNNL